MSNKKIKYKDRRLNEYLDDDPDIQAELNKGNAVNIYKIQHAPVLMKCAECNCTLDECKASNSASECPNCTYSECCCWYSIHVFIPDKNKYFIK